MCEHEASNMNNYSQINPYILIYCNMNIKIGEEMSRESVENVARQIGYMHNAIGHVFKDLIKILSYKFPDNNCYTVNNPRERRQNSPHSNQGNIKNHYRYQQPQPMQIEVMEQPKQRHKQRAQRQKKMPPVPVVLDEQVQIHQKHDKQQQKPPNNDIFNEYAYQKQHEDQSKKDNRDINSIKQNIARIVEGVTNKKRKQGKKQSKKETKSKENQKRQIYTSFERQQQQPQRLKNQQSLQYRSNLSFIRRNQNKTILSNQPSQPQQQNDIFSEFQFESKPKEQEQHDRLANQNQLQQRYQHHQNIQLQKPQIKSPTQQIIQHQPNQPEKIHPSQLSNQIVQQQSEDNRLWQFLKQKQQQQPIYEISDDD